MHCQVNTTHYKYHPATAAVLTGLYPAGQEFTRGAYCLGKVVWGKGWEELLTLLAAHKRAHPDKPLQIDAYGEGEALAAVRPPQWPLAGTLNTCC